MTKRINPAVETVKSRSTANVCAPRTLAHEILNECGDQRSLTLDLECELEFAQQTCLPLVLSIHPAEAAGRYDGSSAGFLRRGR
jgi:hypothetical protein